MHVIDLLFREPTEDSVIELQRTDPDRDMTDHAKQLLGWRH